MDIVKAPGGLDLDDDAFLNQKVGHKIINQHFPVI